MAKSFACSVSDRVSCGAVQLYGGYGTMFGLLVAWFYRDNGILSIGGGTTKIIKEIITELRGNGVSALRYLGT